MGVVLPFAPRPAKLHARPGRSFADAIGVEQALQAAVSENKDRYAVLAAAAPLLEWVRDRYGFAVMRDGLPDEPDGLATALVGLLRGLALLDADLGQGRPLSTFGVYFGRKELGWFDDGCGDDTALAVPDHVNPTELARIVRPRIREAFL